MTQELTLSIEDLNHYFGKKSLRQQVLLVEFATLKAIDFANKFLLNAVMELEKYEFKS